MASSNARSERPLALLERVLAVPEEDRRRVLVLATVVPAWALAVGLAAVFLLDPAVPTWLQYAPLVASALLFGMPHGAVDHLAVARVTGRPVGRALVLVAVGYAVLGGAYAVGWFLAPVAAAVAFVLLTWLHWGQGDVYHLHAVSGGAYPGGRGHRLLVLAVRGAMPMVVPLLAAPDQYRRVLAAFVGLFGGATDPIAPLFSPGVRLAIGAVIAVLSVGAVAVGARQERRRVRAEDGGAAGGPGAGRWWRLDAVETGVLWLYFLSVPPILAVGLYFCLWHAVRHVARLVLLDDAGAAALAEGRVGAALSRFARQAAPLTAAALALLFVLYPLVPVPPADLEGIVALYLVLIAILTLPHVVVVTLMDHRQGVWRRR